MIERLASFQPDSRCIKFRTSAEIAQLADGNPEIKVMEIGRSREGFPLHGFVFGQGSRNVSVIAGCHADEPIGPMTAQCLFWHLRDHFPELLQAFTFQVIPQMNPDGAERNRAWFENPPRLENYLNHVIRELPGDDTEFGFGSDGDERPECSAAMGFLGGSGPYAAHFSLHGLAFAEGAWCLICKEWQEDATTFMSAFSKMCEAVHFPQHDIDRKGDKGFVRIGKGYTTTPHSEPMKQFFLDQGDPTTAAMFKPTSMQFIQSLGGNPLCIVSELPLFHIGTPSLVDLDHLSTNAFKDELAVLRATRSPLVADTLVDICTKYRVSPTPLDLQVRLQTGMIVLALQQVLHNE